jgi:hypothetical protein
MEASSLPDERQSTAKLRCRFPVQSIDPVVREIARRLTGDSHVSDCPHPCPERRRPDALGRPALGLHHRLELTHRSMDSALP